MGMEWKKQDRLSEVFPSVPVGTQSDFPFLIPSEDHAWSLSAGATAQHPGELHGAGGEGM